MAPSKKFEEEINVNEIDFHSVVKDIENIFWLFTLSNVALMQLDTQRLLMKSEFSGLLKKYNDWTGIKIEQANTEYTAHLNVMNQMILFSKTMSILSYDLLLASKYNAKISKDSEIQFLRFIRNGAAHNNKFNLKDERGKWKLKENETIIWRHKEISRILQGQKIFPDFISIFEVLFLIKDISEKLKNIDNLK